MIAEPTPPWVLDSEFVGAVASTLALNTLKDSDVTDTESKVNKLS